jgi:DeoR/GlpR family transcriptional regulator of sugar metabolism
MFIEERHQAILDLLAQKGSITTSEIQEKFSVSYDSAKRDLRILEEKGLLKRTHGGALQIRKIGYGAECGNLSAKERTNNVKDNYLEIAKRAISLIGKGDVIFITSASIGALMASNLPKYTSFTVVTNSISIAEMLRQYDNITTILIGGEMHKNGNTYDAFAIEMINRLRFDKSFITSACISGDFGLSIQTTKNIGLLNAIINNSKQTIGLYPTEKIGFNSIVSICPANKLQTLITDWDASEDDLKNFDEQGIEVIVVDKQE